MCGRLNVVEDPLSQWVSEFFSLPFSVTENHDLRPKQIVSTLVKNDAVISHVDDAPL